MDWRKLWRSWFWLGLICTALQGILAFIGYTYGWKYTTGLIHMSVWGVWTVVALVGWQWNRIYVKETMLEIVDEPVQNENGDWSYPVREIGHRRKIFTIVLKEKYYEKGDTLKQE